MTSAALVGFDPSALAAAIGRRPVRLRHRLTGHPALTRAALAAVAETHPARLVEHHLADLPLVLPSGATEALPLSAREVVDGIEGNGCWMVLWAIDTVASYGALVDEWLAPVRDAVPRVEGRVGRSESLALVASPGAVVPAHVDDNHNVLAQLEGTKQLFVGEFRDPREGQRQIERRYGPDALNLDRLPETITEYTLGPGDAIYLPPYTIHWIVGGTEPSVALSCSFTTEASRRAREVHAFNARLRRIGMTPRPPGGPLWRDRLKVELLRAWLAVRRLPAAARRRLASR